MVEGTHRRRALGTATTADGSIALGDLGDGDYLLLVSAPGYASSSRQVSVTSGAVVVPATWSIWSICFDPLKAGTAGYLLKDATRIGVGLGTVKAHVEHLIAKLGVSDRTQAAVHAVEFGLITPVRR